MGNYGPIWARYETREDYMERALLLLARSQFLNNLFTNCYSNTQRGKNKKIKPLWLDKKKASMNPVQTLCCKIMLCMRGIDL